MKNFMEFVNQGIWNMVVNSHTVPTKVVENKTIKKPMNPSFNKKKEEMNMILKL